MAKFNKDTFLNDITSNVQSAIDKNLITKEDINNNDLERLHGFIQYELLEYIEDRKFALDVLKDFNYDERAPWDEIQKKYGKFKSLLDIALVNLWSFLYSENCCQYSYYQTSNYDENAPMLDLVHNIEDKVPYDEDDGISDIDAVSPPTNNNRQRRKIRLASDKDDDLPDENESYDY